MITFSGHSINMVKIKMTYFHISAFSLTPKKVYILMYNNIIILFI